MFPIADTLADLAQRELPVTIGNVLYLQFGASRSVDQLLFGTLPLVLGALFGLAGRRREREVQRLRLVADIRSVLNRAASLDSLLADLAPMWAESIGARTCGFAVWDAEHNSPAPVHPRSPFDASSASRPVPPDNTPLAKWIIDRNESQILNAQGSLPVLAVPLAVNNRAFGVGILSGTRSRRGFTQSDIGIVSALADQAALTIDHIRTTTEIRRRARDMEAIGQVARSLAAGWAIDRILETVAGNAQVRFGVDYVGILTLDRQAGEFVMRAQAGPLAQDEALNYRQKVTEGLAARVYTTGQMALTRNVREEPNYIGVTGPDARSELILPLRSGKAVIGIMRFASRHVDAFSRDDILALHMLADQVAIAVENARLYEDAQRERQRLRAVLASTGDAVIVTDSANRVQLFNRAAERLFGVPADQVIGARVDETVRQPALIEAYRDTSDAHIFELGLSDTATLMGNLTAVRDDSSEVVGRVLTLHDISDLKRLDQLKSQMIRMASHDLRNPLNAAFGYMGLLREELADREQTAGAYLDGLQIGLRRMQRLIEDLLNVERIESASERVRERVDLNNLARHAVDELRSQANGKQHEIGIQLAGTPAIISADLVQMQQVLVNLIGNAIKYTPNGGRIRVGVVKTESAVVCEVEDNGLGIPKAAQAKLFQRFYRVRMKGTEDIEGTGLGLSLVKAIVEQHQGTIEVDSEEGRGSVFRIKLPALDE